MRRGSLHKGVCRVFVNLFHQPIIDGFRLGVSSLNNNIGNRHGIDMAAILRRAVDHGIGRQFHLLYASGAEQPLTVFGRKLNTGR